MNIDETLLWLCSVASPIGEEKELCDAVVARLSGAKLAGPIRRVLNSIVVPVVRKGGGRPHVGIVGHLDTVRTENGPARIEGDRCFGSGASDMKSGLAVMLDLVERPLEDLKCDLTLAFYSKEEGNFDEDELGPVLDEVEEMRNISFAVAMEPSDNKIHLGCMGSIHATITFVGRTGHSARPWEADNAIMKAAPFLAELAALTPDQVILDGQPYRGVYTVTRASDGGRGRNVVPDRFSLNLNHRFTPNRTGEEAKQSILDLVAGRAEVEFTDVSPPAMPHASHPYVQKLLDAGAKGAFPKQAWTDVARFAALGIPAINFGPGENAQAHQKNESTSLTLLREGAEITRRWLLSLG